jgi:hypothetical protein
MLTKGILVARLASGKNTNNVTFRLNLICNLTVIEKALCHNEQIAALLLNFGLGHVLQYTPVILNFSALHFTHSYTTQEGVPKLCISTHPLISIGFTLIPYH